MALDFMLACVGILLLSAAAFVLFMISRAWKGGPIPGTGFLLQGDRAIVAQDLQEELDAVRRDALAQMSDEDDEDEDGPGDGVVAEGGIVRNCGFHPDIVDAQED